jgi:hypothetical protein
LATAQPKGRARKQNGGDEKPKGKAKAKAKASSAGVGDWAAFADVPDPVKHDEIGQILTHQIERFFAIGGLANLAALIGEVPDQQLGERCVILDDEDRGFHQITFSPPFGMSRSE